MCVLFCAHMLRAHSRTHARTYAREIHWLIGSLLPLVIGNWWQCILSIKSQSHMYPMVWDWYYCKLALVMPHCMDWDCHMDWIRIGLANSIGSHWHIGLGLALDQLVHWHIEPIGLVHIGIGTLYHVPWFTSAFRFRVSCMGTTHPWQVSVHHYCKSD